MPNPQIVIKPPVTTLEPDPIVAGNTQVDGSVVHSNPRAAAKAEIEAQMAALADQEPSGARSRDTRQRMIATKKFDEAHPEYHHRFVNIKDADKLAQRISDGYTEVPRPKPDGDPDASAYGRRLGDEFILMRQPRAKYNARVREVAALTKSRERAHVDEVQKVAENVIERLRSQGFNIPKRAFINEE